MQYTNAKREYFLFHLISNLNMVRIKKVLIKKFVKPMQYGHDIMIYFELNLLKSDNKSN